MSSAQRPVWVRFDVRIRENHEEMLRWLLDGDSGAASVDLDRYRELRFANSSYPAVMRRFLSYFSSDPGALDASDALQWKYTEREDVDDDFEQLLKDEFTGLELRGRPLHHREADLSVSFNLSRLEGVTAEDIMAAKDQMMATWRFAPPPSGSRALDEAARTAQLMEVREGVQSSVTSYPSSLPLEHL